MNPRHRGQLETGQQLEFITDPQFRFTRGAGET